MLHPAPANYILLANGQSLALRAPDYADLDIASVAHALAQINRFTGHACRPYSVAEHSLLVSEIIAQAGGGILAQLAGLMHDAHEIICGDCTSPMKAEMRQLAAAQAFVSTELPHARTFSQFDRVERAAEAAVRTAFRLHDAAKLYAADVRHADLVALATERRDLMPAHPEPWPCLHGVTPIALHSVDLTDRVRARATWSDWRDDFLERYAELDYARCRAERTMGLQTTTATRRSA
ncbi:hypothetical protein LNV47_22590 [Paucibacter sp. DJ4R-1]|nr:hypothetical protein [Paucibacter sp. DJ4R-1]